MYIICPVTDTSRYIEKDAEILTNTLNSIHGLEVVRSVSLLIVNKGRGDLAVVYFQIEPAILCQTVILNVKKSNRILI